MTGQDSRTGPQAPLTARAIEVRAADWLAARDSGRWDAAQADALQAWLAESTRHRVAFLRLEHAWRKVGRLQVHRTASVEPPSAVAATAAAPACAPRAPAARGRWGVPLLPQSLAAGLLVAIGVGMGMLALAPDKDAPWDAGQIHATAVGERAVITLSDGTRVTLNTATRIRAEIGEHHRLLWLDGGEAYFEVAHDPSRPFIIDAGGPSVRVLGTSFTLRRQGEQLQTHVVEGRVQVFTPTGASALLVADEAADATASAVKVRREGSTRREASMSWLQGKLQLDGMTLDQAADEFNRYNRRKLRILDRTTGSIQIGGAFDTTNVDGFARLLKSGFGLDVHTGSKEITVGARPQ